MPRQYPALKSHENQTPAYGTFLQINSPEIVEIAARSGLDFVVIDMEHGSFGLDSAVNMIRAAEAGGAAAIVRVPDCSPTPISRILDAGAVGILLPSVETVQQLEAAVAASHYAPRGSRGACPWIRATGHGVVDWNHYTEWAAQNILVIATVETQAGIDNFEQLVKVEGLSAIGVGQFDLSQSMGHAGNHRHPDVLAKQAELCQVARQNGIDIFGAIFDTDSTILEQEVPRWTSLGARLLAIGGDRTTISSEYKNIAASLQR